MLPEGNAEPNRMPITERWATDVVEAAKVTGKWKIDRSVSRMDDSVKITVSLEATNKNSRGKPVSLNFSCTKSKRDIKAFIDFGEWTYLNSSIANPVNVRIDNFTTAHLWDEDPFNGHIARLNLFYPHYNGSPGSLEHLEELDVTMRTLRSGEEHNIMLIQITPFLKSERILEFQIRGFSEAIKPLIEACDLTNMWPKIPKSAIGIVKGREMVWVVNPQTNKAELRYIYTNINQNVLFNTIESGKVSVRSGLKFGDKIIANPSGITSGMQVNDKVPVFTFTKP